MKNILRFTLVLFTLGLSVITFAASAQAQQTTKITTSPVTFELNANPGETVTNQIKVTNQSDGPLQLEIKVENISGTGEQGQVVLTEEDTKFALSSWVQPSPRTFTLAAKETRLVNFSIVVPANAEPGGHYGSVLVSTVASNDPNTTGAAAVQRVGSLLLVRVAGQAQENAVINSVQTRQFNGEWEEITASDGKTKILVPKAVQSQNQEYGKYFQKGPIAFDVETTNTGNVHVKPVGFVTVYNIFNKKVAELPIDPRNVFPGNERRITVIWPTQSLWGVYYRAQVAAVYGTSNQPLTAQTTFWAFPLPVAIVLGVIILALLCLRKRLTRAVRILIKGA